jgi:hypothetical protein
MENTLQGSPQTIIETEMKRIIDSGNFEIVHLFSEEGLLLAAASRACPVDPDSLDEITLHFQELRKITDVMDNVLDLKEIILEGDGSRKLAFRFFKAFDQLVVLSLVIPPRKTYRKFTNGLVKLIQSVSEA